MQRPILRERGPGVPARPPMLRKCCTDVSACYSRVVLAKPLLNRILVAAFLALLVAVLSWFLLRDGGERAAVPDVAAVRSSDVSDAPRVPEAAQEAGGGGSAVGARPRTGGGG